MELTFTLTERDLRRAQFSVALGKFSAWKRVRFVTAVVAMGALILVAQATHGGPGADLGGAAIRGVEYGLLLVIVFPMLLYLAAFRAARE
jgi:hypothetical protein